MRKGNLLFICLILFLIFNPSLQAQVCPSAVTQLNANEVNASLITGGDAWWDLSDGKYIVPKPINGADPVSAIFAGGLWMGGTDNAGNLKMAAQTYRQSGLDFWPGPIENTTNTASDCQDWDKHFSITKLEIDGLRADFADNGVIDSNLSTNLKGWPGRGNPHFNSVHGFTLPDQQLAPFYDQNNDGIYDPMTGDYPILGLEGCSGPDQYADQMIWNVINDIADLHTNTNGDQMQMEIQVMSYAFNSSGLEYTTFYNYDLLYKGPLPLNDFFFGQFADPDLGCWDNDFVGCDISRSMAIAYNGTATDPDCGAKGYGNTVPLIGFDLLKGLGPTPMAAFISYDNNSTPRGNPAAGQEYYGYLSGFWRDGSTIEFGGNGYQQGTFSTPYMYPDDPTSPSKWSECTAGNAPGDRKFVMSCGPITLMPGFKKEITLGVIFVPDVPHPCPSFDLLRQADDFVQTQFDNCFGTDLLSGDGNTPGLPGVLEDVQLIPNPSSRQDEVQLTNLPSSYTLEFYTANGQVLQKIERKNGSADNAHTLDLKNLKGQALASGLYFVRIVSKKEERVLKLSLF